MKPENPHFCQCRREGYAATFYNNFSYGCGDYEMKVKKEWSNVYLRNCFMIVTRFFLGVMLVSLVAIQIHERNL